MKAVDNTGFEVKKTFWILVLLLILHSIQQNIFQHYHEPYCDYLLKMDRIDKERAVFEQLTLCDFKKWSSTGLETFNNYTIIMTNNSYKIRNHECGVFISVSYFWVNSRCCSDGFHVVFKHFQNLEYLYV